jgi:hypothetical protein
LAPKAGRFADELAAALGLVACVADVFSGAAGVGAGDVYRVEVVDSLRVAVVLCSPVVVYEAATTCGWFAGADWV